MELRPFFHHFHLRDPICQPDQVVDWAQRWGQSLLFLPMSIFAQSYGLYANEESSALHSAAECAVIKTTVYTIKIEHESTSLIDKVKGVAFAVFCVILTSYLGFTNVAFALAGVVSIGAALLLSSSTHSELIHRIDYLDWCYQLTLEN